MEDHLSMRGSILGRPSSRPVQTQPERPRHCFLPGPYRVFHPAAIQSRRPVHRAVLCCHPLCSLLVGLFLHLHPHRLPRPLGIPVCQSGSLWSGSGGTARCAGRTCGSDLVRGPGNDLCGQLHRGRLLGGLGSRLCHLCWHSLVRPRLDRPIALCLWRDSFHHVRIIGACLQIHPP